MGDDLAKLLYQEFLRASGGDPGDIFQRWELLSSTERYAWERTATKARDELGQRFARDMRDASEAFGAEQAIANLLEARSLR